MSIPHDRLDRRALAPARFPGYELDRSPDGAPGLQQPIGVGGPHGRHDAHLLEHWRVLMRHRWLVILFVLVTVLTAAAWTFTTRPSFVATVLLRIEKDEPRVVKFDEVLKADTAQDYYQTQYEILRSRSLANSVIRQLRLDQHPEFQDPERGWLQTIAHWVRQQVKRLTPPPPAVPSQPGSDLEVASPVTDAFLGRLLVEPVKSSRLVKLSFESRHPDLAARVVNTLAETFMVQQLDAKRATTRYAAEFLGTQLDDAGRKLKDAETRLSVFLKANDIFPLGSDKAGEHQDLITQQLAQLSEALLKARAERIAKESLYAQAVGPGASSVPAVLTSPLIARLKEELAKSEAEYRKLGQTFKPEYPRMEQLARSISELRGQLEQEVRRVLNGLDADYKAALRAERELHNAVAGHQQLARKLGDQMPQYSVLRRDVDTNRQVYIALLTRLKETQVSSALITSNFSLVDRAEIPLSPSKPRKTLTLILALIAGLAGGFGLAFLVEYLDTTVKDADEVERRLHVRVLGTVPRVAVNGASIHGMRVIDEATEPDGVGPGARMEPEPVFAEVFRTLRTVLLYTSPDATPTTFLVTSPEKSEGKTTIASHLAMTLAQRRSGEILLVDADLRQPRLHELFGVRRTPGLANVLAGDAEPGEVVHRTGTPNLRVMPAGWSDGTLADLLASPRLEPTLQALAARFKHIIFDTTPLFGVSDALSLVPHVEGVVLVLRHGRAHHDAARRAVHLLGAVGTPLLGVVLNRFNPRSAGTAYYYDAPMYATSGVTATRAEAPRRGA